MLRVQEHHHLIRHGFLGELLSHFPHPASLTNRENRFVYLNPAFERFYGYRSEALLGLMPWILHPRQTAGSDKSRPRSLIEGAAEGWEGRLVHQRADGTRLRVYLITFPLIHPPLRKPALTLGLSGEEGARGVLVRDYVSHFSSHALLRQATSASLPLASGAFRRGDRRQEIARLTHMGYSTKEIANLLDRSPNTIAQVKWRLSRDRSRTD
jgi:PAS domain S-box-containing protein